MYQQDVTELDLNPEPLQPDGHIVAEWNSPVSDQGRQCDTASLY